MVESNQKIKKLKPTINLTKGYESDGYGITFLVIPFFIDNLGNFGIV